MHANHRAAVQAFDEMKGVVQIGTDPGWLVSDFDARWGDAALKEDLLRVARLLEEERSVMGVSAHILAARRRPPEPASLPPGG